MGGVGFGSTSCGVINRFLSVSMKKVNEFFSFLNFTVLIMKCLNIFKFFENFVIIINIVKYLKYGKFLELMSIYYG